MTEIKIGNRSVGPGHPVYVVAELSANHNQDFDQAVRIIQAAKQAGVDAIKLQTYTPIRSPSPAIARNFASAAAQSGMAATCTIYTAKPTPHGNGSRD